MSGSKMGRAFARASALAVLGSCVAGAMAVEGRAQEQALFSLSGGVTAPWGTFADTEIARFDPASGRVVPWLMAATGALFGGDVTGDGATDDWKDVDALWVGQESGRITDVWISFNTTHGAWLDGDLLRLKEDGTLQLLYAESQVASWFGLTDGQQDVDGLHVALDGKIYVSFSDDEPSSSLSTDSANLVTDGSIVVFDPSRGTASVVLTEAQVDARVSAALKKTIKTTDTLGLAMDANGVLCFSVQSPSSDDASVFRDRNGGELLIAESALQLTGSPEIDALDLQAAPASFLATRVTPRLVAGNVQPVIDVDGPANHVLVVTLATVLGDMALLPIDGFCGLLLDPTDPLFSASLADFTWTYAATDALGHAALVLDPAPAGTILTVYAQAYDFDGRAVGTPIAIELTG